MIAVLDIGKTNVKLSAVSDDGAVLETLSVANTVHPAPPYRHHDVLTLEHWLVAALADLATRHSITAIVPCGHGSGAVLVDDAGPVMPMIDYEDDPPADITARYRRLAGSEQECGSPIMLGASHTARQLLWLETGWPEVVHGARWFLGLPQYWAWRLSGIAAAEYTVLGAQSHLWTVPERRFATIVAARAWHRLMPPRHPAWATLGTLCRDLARRTGLPATTRVLCGIHDSSANFYRYQAAGLRALTVVSTGTWIVALSDQAPRNGQRTTCNANPDGNPLTGALCMGGREFSLIAGAQPPDAVADRATVAQMVASGSFALPCFGEEDGLFPGRAGRGRFEGPPPESAAERRALALLTVVLLTDTLLDSVATGTVVLDGTFVRDPLYPALLALLRPSQTIVFNLHGYGTAAGAALLAAHETRAAPAPLALQTPALPDLPGLPAYRARWRALTETR